MEGRVTAVFVSVVHVVLHTAEDILSVLQILFAISCSITFKILYGCCLLYTSDAADE